MASLLILNTGAVYASGGHSDHNEQEEHQEEAKGPNNGRMLNDGDFAIELALFERGVPAEYRVYPTFKHQKVAASDVKLSITLTRLGGIEDKIKFIAAEEFLKGDMTIYEPHSFAVEINAQYQGKDYRWHFENFEGRTQISPAMAKQMGVVTEPVGAQMLEQTLTVYGQLELPVNAVRHISARYPGKVTKLNAELGQAVTKGQHLLTIESDESLQSYRVYAPIAGIISEQLITAGEQAGRTTLLTITDASQLIAHLNVYPAEQATISLPSPVTISLPGQNVQATSKIFDRLIGVNAQQAKIYRAKINNEKGNFTVGQFVQADIVVARFEVAKAVKRDALQGFRDFTVVYEKIGEHYEVRMLELGRIDAQWVEVLSGIKTGSDYVSGNSYLIKADIDKEGAAHDH